MVANSHIFTFSFIQHSKQKSPEITLNIGFFGFFVYCYIITISLEGCTLSDCLNYEKKQYEKQRRINISTFSTLYLTPHFANTMCLLHNQIYRKLPLPSLKLEYLI
ncbi:hypothetical protein HNP69_003017 [Chryseobacterium koreense]|nr:hypothetical protein [Chryseobacterium koreense]